MLKESKEFRVTIKNGYVLLSIVGKKSGTGHHEALPPRVAIAMGNHLIRVGREALHEGHKPEDNPT